MDVIIVLGSSIHFPEVMRDRVAHGARLYFQGRSSRIVLSGGPNNPEKIPEASIMREIAIELGVPDRAITVETESLDTIANARLCRPLLQELGARTAFLVTSAYHIRRAAIIFRAVVPEIRFELSACTDSFSDTELSRRLENEERQYRELPADWILREGTEE